METESNSPFLVLNLGLDVVDRTGRFDLKRDRLPGERLDKDLHTAAAAQEDNEMKRGLLLDVVIRERAVARNEPASEDKTLLVRRNAAR